MKVTFYIVRHGETIFNQQGRLQGHSDSPLTSQGIQQAHQLQEALATTGFEHAYISPLERTMDTAAIVLNNRQVKIDYDERLMEQHIGKYEGSRYTTHWEETNAYFKAMDYAKISGESKQQFKQRIDDVFQMMIQQAHDQDRILVVTHGLVQLMIMHHFFGIDLETYFAEQKKASQPPVPNCGILVMTVEDGQFDLIQKPIAPQQFEPLVEQKRVNFLFVRHGETLFNQYNRMQGRADSPLTNMGIQQAEQTGFVLKEYSLQQAYCSTALRARKTMALILRHHPNVPYFYEKDLREVDFGQFEGKVRDSAIDEIKQRHQTEMWSDVGGEDKPQIQKRIRRVILKIVSQAKDQDTILVVSHGTLYLNMLETLFGLDRQVVTMRMMAESKPLMPNGGVCQFHYQDGQFWLDHFMEESTNLKKGL